MNQIKKVKFSFSTIQRHWVGDGFYVYGLLRPDDQINQYINPFILADYASPYEFISTKKKRGVGEHPHRGFETVTLAIQGEIEHRDSSGGGGVIKAGDIQWMTAGKGVVHDEFHSDSFSKNGGTFEMLQLWINLPKKNKMTSPKYQGIKNEMIPELNIGKSSLVRVIAGELKGQKGPAQTFSDINMYEIKGEEEDFLTLDLKENTNTVLLILDGKVNYQNEEFQDKTTVVFERDNIQIKFKTSKNFRVILLNGEPINEPIFAYGPIVMNSREEIIEAIEDFQNGMMGTLD